MHNKDNDKLKTKKFILVSQNFFCKLSLNSYIKYIKSFIFHSIYSQKNLKNFLVHLKKQNKKQTKTNKHKTGKQDGKLLNIFTLSVINNCSNLQLKLGFWVYILEGMAGGGGGSSSIFIFDLQVKIVLQQVLLDARGVD